MTRPRAGLAQGKRPNPPQPKPPVDAARATVQPKPFTPQRKIFVVLMIVFALWVAALVVMYFATVYPSQEKPPIPEREGTGASTLRNRDR